MSQTVAVENGDNGKGYGWMFRHKSVCYVILPEHVAGRHPRITLTSSAPALTGTGTVSKPFWEGIDLAIATVRGAIEERCSGTLSDLALTPVERASRTAQLERLTSAGEVMRDPITIDHFTYRTFTARRRQDGKAIRQGTSGAFAFVGNKPVGMAIKSPEDTTGLFIRSDEIHLNVNRYVNEIRAPRAVAADTVPSMPGALPLVLRRTSAPPINPQYAPENLLGAGPYVFDLSGRVTIEFDIPGEGVSVISRVLITAPSGGDYSLPHEIFVEVSPFPGGGRYFALGRFQMGFDGVLDTGRVASRNARRLRLTVLNAWSDGPVAIEEVRAF
ncbi:hypothetical protein [Pontibaca salina]|uniref:Uncharacterized protein n=1 Tax=Pontibaca salina TaxID=2795731 RepID=A0A934HUL6_9RHOB|nr:hypothetical protein [Pontibaca salina]MBI6630810.1 hypothetical protein [Pontibaca salina]